MLSFKVNPKKRDALDRALGKGLSHKSIKPVLQLKRGVVAERDPKDYWGKLNPYYDKSFEELEKLHDEITERMSVLPAYSQWAVERMAALKKAFDHVTSAPNWPK